jgi:hypothetical protein
VLASLRATAAAAGIAPGAAAVDGATVHEGDLETPAYEDMSEEGVAVELTGGASAEDPLATNTPSKKAARWRRGRFGR